MSERELQRIGVLSQIMDGRLSVDAAAHFLAISRRQVFRLLKSFRTDGAVAVRHKARGRPPNNRIKNAGRDYALALIRENYADFGPTLAAEMLAKHHAFTVSRETLRCWRTKVGIWLPCKERGDPCTLLVFVDDATSTLMELRFVPSESTFSYFLALRSYLETHGRPVAFYSDRNTVFRVARSKARNGDGITQFVRALSELNREIQCANSSEAKGRVERTNRTLQDRLVKELRLAGISDIGTANRYLPDFMARFNQQSLTDGSRFGGKARSCPTPSSTRISGLPSRHCRE